MIRNGMWDLEEAARKSVVVRWHSKPISINSQFVLGLRFIVRLDNSQKGEPR